MRDNLNRKAAIVGVAESDLGKVPGKTALQLQAEAAREAVKEAGLTFKDIDGIFAHTDSTFPSILLAEYLGIRPTYTDTTNIGGPSNISHIIHAIAAIEAGLCTTALITFGSTQASDNSRKLGGVPEDPRTPRGQFIVPYGQFTPLGFYAMVARRHMHQYGTTSEQLAEVAVAARKWAMLNPKAYKRESLTVEDVVNSTLIADPLHKLDCCLVTDGGGAIVVTSGERAKSTAKKQISVLGMAEGHTHQFTPFELEDWLHTGIVDTGKRAFEMAGIEHQDLDVVQLYDSFTITVLQTLEDLGFCKRGEGGEFVSGGRIAPGGEFPLNTSGGGLSYCHPGMFGTFLIIEAVRQLRGECEERQVDNAKLALCHGTGLIFSSQATMILGRD